jgi:hypothetical protein
LLTGILILKRHTHPTGLQLLLLHGHISLSLQLSHIFFCSVLTARIQMMATPYARFCTAGRELEALALHY